MTDALDLECPFCEDRPLDWKCMVEHLLKSHGHVFKTWTNAQSQEDYFKMIVQCPCIATFYKGDFHNHLRAVGNLVEHFLEVMFGLKDGRQ